MSGTDPVADPAATTEPTPLLEVDDLRRVLLAYLGPLLEPERVNRPARARNPKPATTPTTP